MYQLQLEGPRPGLDFHVRPGTRHLLHLEILAIVRREHSKQTFLVVAEDDSVVGFQG